MKYFFLLGTTPELSSAEISSVCPSGSYNQLLPRLVEVELASDDDAVAVFGRLGGSVKCLRSEGQFTALSEEELQERVVAYLAQSERPTFHALLLGEKTSAVTIDQTQIKKALKEKGISSRYHEGDKDGLSAAILLHHPDVIELGVIQIGDVFHFGRTLCVQDIDDWTKRDRSKPYANHAKGMLPPKIARIMTNLASEAGQNPQVLYDPFCGTGTVLLEGLHTGWTVIGSDLDPQAVAGTTQNCNWYLQAYNRSPQEKPSFEVFASDVHTADAPLRSALQKLGLEKLDAIVTEPFLGRQTPDAQELANVFKGLEKLYLGAFKSWQKLLKVGGRVVIVLPKSQLSTHTWRPLVDRLSEFGYTPTSDPLKYARPGAIIEREIWVFRKG